MKIESSLKHFSPKGMMITDSPGATMSELNGTDVMAAIGMCQAKAGFGMTAYLGKAGISEGDREKSVKSLSAYALKTAPALIRKAAGKKLGRCMLLLAKLAYDDYARSAADTSCCPDCSGRGVTNTLARVMTHPGCGSTPARCQLQPVENICITCNGKGKLPARCRCGGSGRVRDVEASQRTGAPVEKNCPKCSGLGFRRLPGAAAFRAMSTLMPDLQERTWNRNWRPFLEQLVAKCEIEESRAGEVFQRVTR